MKAFVWVMGVLLLVAAGTARAEIKVGWKGSTFVEDTEAGHKVQIGGRIMNDWGLLYPDDELRATVDSLTGGEGSIEDGTMFRRVRLFVGGTLYHVVEFKSQIDFAAGRVAYKDVYLGVKDIPVLGRVRVGHQHEPTGLEKQTTSNVITFLERGITLALTPERNTGIAFIREHSAGVVQGGVFLPSSAAGDASGTDYVYDGRVTYAPLYDAENASILHLGASASFREDQGGLISFGGRPENNFLPVLTAVEFAGKSAVTAGGEAAWIGGPASLQGEVQWAAADASTVGDPNLLAFYVYGAYTLTGEARTYERGKGVMGGITPDEAFDGKGALGAWEVAARFSRLDLTDAGVSGGEAQVVTLGLNWYLNASARVMLNYSNVDLEGGGTANSLLTRFQVSF